jgi:hypothetical protein
LSFVKRAIAAAPVMAVMSVTVTASTAAADPAAGGRGREKAVFVGVNAEGLVSETVTAGLRGGIAVPAGPLVVGADLAVATTVVARQHWLLTAGVNVGLERGSFRPYLYGRIGELLANPKNDDQSARTIYGPGLGLEWRVAGQLSLIAEIGALAIPEADELLPSVSLGFAVRW